MTSDSLWAGLASPDREPVWLTSLSSGRPVRFVILVMLVLVMGLAPGCHRGGHGKADQRLRTSADQLGAQTEGGRGGRILLVTTLASRGTGSLRAAVEEAGRRIVMFEVGGIIDLAGQRITIREPLLTIAGDTAPSPGITLIRGGIRVETHDVVVQHLRVRPGEAGHEKQSGWEVDGITTAGPHAHDIVIDHCSMSWATDENLTASGPRFQGAVPEEWRRGTSRHITFSHNIVAEGLSRSTHRKGEHSKGTLIHDNVTGVLIIGNLYAHNVQRNPFFKGGATGVVVNNVIYNPGTKAVHYALRADEWGERAFQTGRIAVLGNVLKLGPDSEPQLPLVLIEGDGPLELFEEDNLVVDKSGREVESAELVHDPGGHWRRMAESPWLACLVHRPASEVLDWVAREAGARPWDRDAADERIVRNLRSGEGRIIDSEEQVGGYPRPSPTRRLSNEAQRDFK